MFSTIILLYVDTYFGRDWNDLFKWNAMIKGPDGTPYAGVMFSIDIKFPINYTFSALNLRSKL
uniref:UBC core domain-containing protein n=1 Tax=Brassica oleracea TaxID=3712 RepID=A0A3P6FB25_BRAOL|nr:unnamed protein product [Brassica oleracea]